MTTISSDDVAHLAALSSLQLSENEAEQLRVDLENILGHVKALAQLDTDRVEPTYQVTDLDNVLREDAVDEGPVSGEALVQLAPEFHDNQIKVPKVL